MTFKTRLFPIKKPSKKTQNDEMLTNALQSTPTRLCVLGKVAESWQCFFCMGGLTNAASSSSSCPAKTAKTRNYGASAAF
jgi:hypothetical protein